MVVRYFFIALFLSYSTLLSSKAVPAEEFNVTNFQHGKETTTSAITLWQRELLTIRIEILTSEEFAYLKADNWENRSFVFDKEPASSVKYHINNLFKKSIILNLWPVNAGQQSVELPVISLMLSGRAIQQIKIEPLSLQVKHLPDYLPPGFPVGTISLSDRYDSNAFLPFIFLTDNLASYQLKINTTGLHADFIPDYSKYLRDSDIRLLPVMEKTENHSADIGYVKTQTLTMPVLLNNSGLHSFAPLRVLSFNPATGKIVSAYFSPAKFLSLNVFLHLLLLVLLLASVYWLTKLMVRIKINTVSRRYAWQQICQSQDSHDLSRALRQLPASHAMLRQLPPQPVNMSLSQWAAGWRNQALSAYISTLNAMIFAETADIPFQQLKHQIIHQLKRLDHWPYYYRAS